MSAGNATPAPKGPAAFNSGKQGSDETKSEELFTLHPFDAKCKEKQNSIQKILADFKFEGKGIFVL